MSLLVDHVPEGIHQPSYQTCPTWNLQTMFYRNLLHLLKFWSTENTEKLRKVLHLVCVPVVGFDFPFDLFGFECFFCYVWIFDFLTYVLVLMLLMRGYALKYTCSITKISRILFNICNFVLAMVIFIVIKCSFQ